jgi:hypothetical protein
MSDSAVNLEELFEALRAMSSAIERIDGHGAVIGGVAVSLQVQARFTADVDAVFLAASHSVDEMIEALAQAGFRATESDPIGFARASMVIPLVHVNSGIRADVALGWLPFEEDAIRRADIKRVEEFDVRVVRREDLLIMKLIANRPKDYADADTIIRLSPDLDVAFVRSTLEEFAEVVEDPDLLPRFDRLLGQ